MRKNDKIKQSKPQTAIGVLILLIIIILLFPKQQLATTVTNHEYRIEKGNIHLSPPTDSWLDNQSTDDSDKNIHPSSIEFTHDSNGTRARDGIRFKITSLVLDYGIFTPTSPIIRSQQLTIETTYASFASVALKEDQNLTATATILPPTSCDNGSCNERLASIWENVLTYGFGYTCESDDSLCQKDIIDTSYFRQVPSSNDIPVLTLNGGIQGKAKIYYKVNVSGTQKEDVYKNHLFYTLNPGI